MGHTQARCPKLDSSLPFRPDGWNARSDGLQRHNNRPPPLTRPNLAMSTVHPSSPDCPPVVLLHDDTDQPFDSASTGSSEDADLVPVQLGEDWIAKLDDDLTQPAAISGDSFRISTLQREDPVCMYHTAFMDCC